MQDVIREQRAQVFIPDDNLVWLSAQILGEIANNQFEIEIDDIDFIPTNSSKRIRIFRSTSQVTIDKLPLQNVGIGETGVDDMCFLNYLHEASVLDNLHRRFKHQLPYTYTGNICIAINPYQWLDIYTDNLRDIHMKKLKHELTPHVYSTSSTAYRGLRDYQKNQSILVSGESGAGKTETVKILMGHLAYISGKKNDQTIEKVLQANPLLESFGNAKTSRNDNSSRFGKFTQLQFDDFSQLCGSRCVTYLLEKCRVVSQNHDERNYHIFHQLFASHEGLKSRFHLAGKTACDFRYTSRGDTRLQVIEGVTDGARFRMTEEALDLIGVPEMQRTQLQQIIAGILYLGEVRFLGDADTSNIDPQDSHIVEIVCELLGVDSPSFTQATTFRSIEAEGSRMQVSLSRDQASDSREGLAKEIYARLFLWLVNKINDSTSSQDPLANQRTVSLLDIFGFESFEFNRFEQLCINYANEKLQQKFTQDMFMTVQREYQEEGLRWEQISYRDNQETIDLFEGRMGLLALLNEECLVPKGTDLNFLSKFQHNSSRHPSFSKTALMTKQEFCIHHFAGKVTYEVEGFLERNKDALQEELKKIMVSSSNDLVVQIFSAMIDVQSLESVNESSPQPNRSRGGGVSRRQSFMRAETVTTKFKSQLSSLMDTISLTDVQYVRCIKPNSSKSPTQYDRQMVVEQLRCAGMIEAIRISRAAFPYRVTHEEFLARFGALSSLKLNSKGKVTSKDKCQYLLQHLVQHLSQTERSYELGRSKVYFTAGVLEVLEALRGKRIFFYVVQIQKNYRMSIEKRKFQVIRNKLIQIQSEIRRHQSTTLYQHIRHSVHILQRSIRVFLAIRKVDQMRKKFHSIRIQSWARMLPVRRLFLQKKHSTTLVATFIRMYQAKSKYIVKIHRVRQEKQLSFQIEMLKEQLEQEIKSKEELIAHYQSSSTQEVHSRLKELEQELATSFETRITSLLEENKTLQEEHEQSQHQINELKIERSSLQELNSGLQKQLHDSTEAYETELNRLEEHSNQIIEDLEKQIVSMKREEFEFEKSKFSSELVLGKAILESEVKTLKALCEQYQSRSEEDEKKIKDLEDTLSLSQQSEQLLTQKNHSLEIELANHMNDLNTAREEFQHVEEIFLASQTERTQLQTENTQLQAQLSLLMKLTSSSSALSSLSSSSSSSSSSSQDVTQTPQYLDLQQQNLLLNNELLSLLNSNEQLTQHNLSLSKSLDSFKTQLSLYQTQSQEQFNQQQTLNQLSSSFETVNQHITQRISLLDQENSHLKQHTLSLTDDISTLQETLRNLSQSKVELEQQLRMKEFESSQSLLSQTSLLQSQQEQMESLQLKIQSFSVDLDKEKEEKNSLLNRIQQLEDGSTTSITLSTSLSVPHSPTTHSTLSSPLTPTPTPCTLSDPKITRENNKTDARKEKEINEGMEEIEIGKDNNRNKERVSDLERERMDRLVAQLRMEKSHILESLLQRSEEIDTLTEKNTKFKKRILLEKQMRHAQNQRIREFLQANNAMQLESYFFFSDTSSHTSDMGSEIGSSLPSSPNPYPSPISPLPSRGASTSGVGSSSNSRPLSPIPPHNRKTANN